MTKIKNVLPLHADGSLDLDLWLNKFLDTEYKNELLLLRNACALSQLSGHNYAVETGEVCLHHALYMVDVLVSLNADMETIVAAMMFVNVHYAELSMDDITEQFGTNVGKLVSGVCTMSATSLLNRSEYGAHHQQQVGNIRKMLLAMVDDVRIVLIKLADRLCILRNASHTSDVMRKAIAAEAMDVYAPLANCLGVGSVKWEMEDLAFRYLNPGQYKDIAKNLKAKRDDRERYVKLIIDELQTYLTAMDLKNFRVYGRAKHIYSIFRKMMNKKIPLEQIYDATAVRVLVETTEQCYEVLGVIDTLWQQIPQEFDDYISHPKINGYRSLHTAVKGPENRFFEVQIRTFAMHEQAEQGVAAHWKYKANEVTQTSHERKIEWLREVLAWHRDVSGESLTHTTFIDDRVYVFTPNSDIIDLPVGSTPLDFAYHVHSDLGHRCRGAKINGSIVPLSYNLKTTDVVEILTSKEPKPSRDWINPHLHYLQSSKAKAKVLHWFKMQDYEQNCNDGKELLEKELKALGLKFDQLNTVIPYFHFKTLNDLCAALGRGEVKLQQILHKLVPPNKIEPTISTIVKQSIKSNVKHNDLKIEGVGQLLTHMARCCQPIPGDEVIGYITLGRGVSVHRKDCSNILHASARQRERLVMVNWSEETHHSYEVDVIIKAFDRPTLLRDITAVLATDQAHVLSIQTQIDQENNINYIMLRVSLSGLDHWVQMCNHLRNIPNVLDVQRQS